MGDLCNYFELILSLLQVLDASLLETCIYWMLFFCWIIYRRASDRDYVAGKQEQVWKRGFSTI